MVLKLSGSSACQFEVEVSHLQIALFHAGLPNPFNQWTQTHTNQGFSWRPESVSFRTLDDGKARIVAETVRDFRPRPGSIRALQVPFTVGADRLIEVASIIESRVIEINVGTYQLFFQAGFDEHEVMWCDFSFLETEKPTFAILKADGELNIPDELSLSAIAAT